MGKPAAREGDMVMGVDTHIVMIPSPGGPVPTPLPSPFTGKLSGDLSHALILDSYGSAAAEAAAEAAEAMIREKISESGLKASPRFSPGYGGWNVAEQKWVFAAVEGEKLGVRLTPGQMLVPRKSITFGYE